jgi:serpin B
MMMHKLGSYRVMHGDQFDALELPYKGGKISMLIVLPKKMDGLTTVESEMTGPMIDRIAAGMDSHFLALSLPKFKFSFQTSLQTALEAMGITAAFKRDEADFSGIDGRRDLFVADAVHKAFIAVDEAGTEAAAASGIVMMPTAIPMPRETFTIDHPFLFLIRDNSSGAVLFMGRVLDPGSE